MSDVIFEPIATESSTAPPGLSEGEVASSSDSTPPPDPPTQEVVAEPVTVTPEPKKRGRPKGSPNKPKAPAKEPDPVPPPQAPTQAPPPKAKTKATPKARAPKVKQPPQPPTEEESSSDGEERQIYHKLKSDDLETSILQFLTNRRVEQQTMRKDLWANLARSGLR